MRLRISPSFGAASLTIALLPVSSGLAQTAPAQPATPSAQPTTQSPTLEPPATDTYDLERAIMGESGGITADEAGKRARARAPQYYSAEAAATAAEWEAKSAWTGFIPNLLLFAQYKRINLVNNNINIGFPEPTPEQIANLSPTTLTVLQDLNSLLADAQNSADFTQPLNNYSLGATLTVPVSDIFLRVMPAYEGSKGIAEARKLQAQSTAEIAELQGREAFYRYAAAVALLALRQQAVRQAEAVVNQTSLFVNAGTKAKVELLAATANLERARGEVAQAEGALATARNALAVITGMRSEELRGLGERVMELPPPPAQTQEQLVDHALEHRTELLALRKAVGATQKLQNAERNAAYPQLSAEGTILYANPNPRYVPPVEEFNHSWEVGVTLSWTPNQALNGKRRSKRLEAEVAKARADLAAMEDAVRVEVVEAYQNFLSAVARAQATEAAVKAAEENYRVRLATYRVGAGVLIDLTDADRQLNEARLDYVASAIQARLALAQLRRRASLD